MKKITVLFTVLALILGLCACSVKSGATTWQEQYDLGLRYLSEGIITRFSGLATRSVLPSQALNKEGCGIMWNTI